MTDATRHDPDSRAIRDSERGSAFRRLSRLARKELRESLRDRRTLATLILMPLIVYPLLGSVVQKFAISRIDPNSPAAAVVMESTLSPGLQSLFAEPGGEEKSRQQSTDSTGQAPVRKTDSTLPGKPAPEKTSLEGLTTKILTGELPNVESAFGTTGHAVAIEKYVQPPGTDLESLVQHGRADIAIRELQATVDPQTGTVVPGSVAILAREGDAFSMKAAAEAERRVQEFREEFVRSLLDQTPFGREAMPSIVRVALEISGPRESPLSAFVPLMLVLMTMTGAVYPAIDLTAGERERGTLEMLLAAPVSRRSLLTAKFVAVFTVAVLTAIINLTAMILTLYGTGFDRVVLGDGVTITTFLQVLALLVVFASFFSAVLLSITSFARSFREAQAWLIPLMLISLAPGILSLMPGVRLTVAMSLLPLINIVLLGKELFQGIAAPHLFVITLVATLTYTVLALGLAASVFGSDTVLFASDAGAGSLAKRPKELTDSVPLKLGIGCLLILVPAFVVLAGLRGRLVEPDHMAGQLVLSAVITLLLFVLLPAVLSAWNRISLASAFGVRSFRPLALPGAILLGATLWTFSYEALLAGKSTAGWMKLLDNPQLRELAVRLTQETPLLLRLITLAAIPAICEELFFRGFLLSALRGNSGRWKSALPISTFLFAAFHVIVDQSLTFERFPVTFLLGFVLGWIRIASGSVLPSIAMHMVSNAVLLSLSELEPLLAYLGVDLAIKNESHLPTSFLGIAALLAILGAFCVRASSQKPGENSASAS